MRKSILAWSACLGAAAAGSLACTERGRPDPDVQMAVSHEREAVPQAEEGGGAARGAGAKVPSRLEVPDAVVQAYSAIMLAWKDASSGKSGTLEVPLGGSAALPGSSLTVSAEVFLPAFTMNAQVITSDGIEQANPAAQIRVTENGKEIFAGWVFKRFPDAHPFTHPRFSLQLDGGVPKKPA